MFGVLERRGCRRPASRSLWATLPFTLASEVRLGEKLGLELRRTRPVALSGSAIPVVQSKRLRAGGRHSRGMGSLARLE